MKEHPITLRAAKPTVEEGLEFERYLNQAAEGFFRFLLGRRAPEIVAAAFIKPNHDFSFQNVTFAELDNEIVGMASGFSAEQHRFSDQVLKQAAGRRAVRYGAVKFLCGSVWRFLDTIHDGEFYLQAIAVDSERRSEGIGSKLIEFIEERAKSSGSERLVLDVVGRNEGARRLYERRGMNVESQWPKRWNVTRFRIYRMGKALRSK